VGDTKGLFVSCDQELSKLRQMSLQPFPVRFTGFDKLFNEVDVYSPSNVGSGKLAIIDMGISSIFRTQPAGGAAYDGSISRATVNMTIQEIPRDIANVIKFPKLPFKPIPQPSKKTGDKDSGECARLFSRLASIQSFVLQKRSLISECAQVGAANSKLGRLSGGVGRVGGL
jgi:hypothetical protein